MHVDSSTTGLLQLDFITMVKAYALVPLPNSQPVLQIASDLALAHCTSGVLYTNWFCHNELWVMRPHDASVLKVILTQLGLGRAPSITRQVS